MSTLGRGLHSLIPPNDGNDDAARELINEYGLDEPELPPPSDVFNDPGAVPPPVIFHVHDGGDEGGENADLPMPVAEPSFPDPATVPSGDSAEDGGALSHKTSSRVERPEISVPRASRSRERAHPYSKVPEAVFHIEVDNIKPNPDQPRRTFDEASIRELAASIREFGLLQPVVVSKVEREVPTGTEIEYRLISGERRLLAAKTLGLERIPAIVRSLTYDREGLELAVIENIQRENLNPIELARAYARLQDEFRLTQREIATRLGKSREVVANAVRLLDLPPDIQEALERGDISESHGRLLLTIEDPALQERLFHDLVDNRLTTRELRNKARAAVPSKRSSGDAAAPPSLPPEIKNLQDRVSAELGAPVAIQQNGQSGRITINFYSDEELRNLLDRLVGRDEL